MRKLTGIFAMTLLLFVAASAPAVHADNGRLSKKPVISHDGKSFSLSGQISGGLEGIVRVGDYKVFITKKTVLYSTTDGKIEPGTHIIRKPVYVSGSVDSRGRFIASMVVVNESPGNGGRVGVLPDDVAQ